MSGRPLAVEPYLGAVDALAGGGVAARHGGARRGGHAVRRLRVHGEAADDVVDGS